MQHGIPDINTIVAICARGWMAGGVFGISIITPLTIIMTNILLAHIASVTIALPLIHVALCVSASPEIQDAINLDSY